MSIVVRAHDGPAGGTAGTGQGSDQGEDQGENIFQFGKGSARIGPTSVSADNTITSGNANGGSGGSVTVVFNNYVTTTCAAAATQLVSLPETVVIKAGNGGGGGGTGHGQGADQGEDQGENIGQFSLRGAGLSPTAVSAINKIVSGDALGGAGGNVSVTVNTYATCAPPSAGPKQVPPPTEIETKNADGDIAAIFTTYAACQVIAQDTYTLQAGDGSAGGLSGKGQGSDQGEDQGENIGQFASGSPRGGPTTVLAPNNVLLSADTAGGGGASISATFDNYIDLTCATSGASSGGSIHATAGNGGPGGESGSIQGSDQGEDQGENIGQFGTRGVSIGPVTVNATNSIASGTANGGTGGNASVAYHDYGTCANGTLPSFTVNEGLSAVAGRGGGGGKSGSGQGSDQGEDQGENIGQFAERGAKIRLVRVEAHNTNLAGPALGGTGGSVAVAYHDGSCTVPTPFTNELAAATGGNGGAGGSSGKNQGADQGEDQGENIGQFAKRLARIGSVSVRAVNLNVSGDVSGGNGGNVLVPGADGSCSTADARVLAAPGAGGRGGDTGVGQGSDQGEDQGENIGQFASKSSRGHNTVWASNTDQPGPADTGVNGVVQCQSAASALSRTWPNTSATTPFSPSWLNTSSWRTAPRASGLPVGPPDPGQILCDGSFRGRAHDLEVPVGGVCHLKRGSFIKHNVEVGVGGSLYAVGARIGHDLAADQPRSVHVSGGRIGHDLLIENPGFRNQPASVLVCGVRVEHNLLVSDGSRSASPIVIGGRHCAGNIVGADLSVEVNLGAVTVRRNHAGHDANCFENRKLSAGRNQAVHLNNCPPLYR